VRHADTASDELLAGVDRDERWRIEDQVEEILER
jgi:hypothetical protein